MTRRSIRAAVAVGVATAVSLLNYGDAQAIVGGQSAGSSYGAVGEVVIQPSDGTPMSTCAQAS